MRLLRITLIAATIAAIATVSEAVRPYQMRRIYQQAIDHQSGGITVSDTRFFTGTDTGTMEERSHDGFLLNVRNTYVTGSGTFTFNNETNRLGGFSQLALGVANDVFYFCSEDNNAVYRYDTGSNVMTRMAGDGTPGLTAGTGTAAKIDCGQSAVQSARDDGRTKLYMFSGRPGASNYGIVSVVATSATGVDAGVLTIVAGSGTSGHTDATGTSAQIQNPHAMLYFKNTVSTKDYLIMSFDDNQGPIRYLDLTTGAVVTTMITYDATVLQSGTDNKAKLPAVTGLVNVPGKPFGFGITGSSRAFTLSWQPALGSFRVEFNPQLMSGKWGAAMKPDGTRVFFGNSIPGNGTIARFEVVPMTQSKSVPPTRTHTATHTPPSKTHPHTRSRTVPPPKTPAPPTPKPPTPAPTNAPPGSVTTLAPGATTNTTINAAVGSTTYVACACAVAALLGALW